MEFYAIAIKFYTLHKLEITLNKCSKSKVKYCINTQKT